MLGGSDPAGPFSVSVSGQATANETELYIKISLKGFVLVLLAASFVAEHLRKGTLVEVLTAWQPPPVPFSQFYPHQLFLSPAVRAFTDWVDALFQNEIHGKKTAFQQIDSKGQEAEDPPGALNG